MLYAAVHNKAAWPLGAEEIEYLEKRLRHFNYNYQVGAERRMFESHVHPEYRFVLLKWEHRKDGNIRNVLLETHDIEQMASALKMLISIEETEVKQRS
jgi:hypothetical protein